MLLILRQCVNSIHSQGIAKGPVTGSGQVLLLYLLQHLW